MRIDRRPLAAVIGTVLALVASLAPGPAGPPVRAIVGGSEIPQASLGQSAPFSWLVRLEGPASRCTGSLVHADWVLTAAHCAEIGIEGGSGGITGFVGDDTEGVAVTEVHINPDWQGGVEADLALMRLAGPSVHEPVRLPGFEDGLVTGTPITLAGWGVTESGGSVPSVPSSGQASIEFLSRNMIETGGGAIGCDGDSGGPMLAGTTLVAVISSSDQGCLDATFGPRVTAHRTWILGIADPGALDNEPPVALSGSIEATKGESVEVGIRYSDPDGDAVELVFLDFGVFSDSVTGDSCTGVPGDFTCTLTPPTNFVGTTTVTYEVEDVFGARATGIWEITYRDVPAAPVAETSSVTVTVDRAVTIELLAFDPNGDPLTFAILDDGPAHGTLTDCTFGVCDYVPDAGYTGPDQFRFTASDGSLVSAPATVSIEVIADLPPIAESATYQVSAGTPSEVYLLAGDPNGDPVTFQILDPGPAHGTLSGCTFGVCVYTPTAGYEGPDAFTFLASDGTGESAPATITLEVVANLTPTVFDVGTTTKSGVPVTVDLLVSDPDSIQIEFQATDPSYGSLTSCEYGQCIYTPDPGFVGTDSFSYTAFDGTSTSLPATATIEVLGASWTVTPFENGADPAALAAVIANGAGVNAPTLVGATAAIGRFENAGAVFGIDEGILLSSGRVADALGPNLASTTGTAHDLPGDDQLSSLAGVETNDAVVLEFDLVPTDDVVELRYVFASEEYDADGYVTADYNDTAMISVGGQPCTLPGDLPISVGSLRQGVFITDEYGDSYPEAHPVNEILYVGNPVPGEHDTELNGFSTVQTCTTAVTPGTAVRVRIAIADGGDGGIDSALFIEGTADVGDGDPLEQLIAAVAGAGTSLEIKVENLAAALAEGRTRSACGLLGGFVNEVSARAGDSVQTDQAATLLGLAGELAASIPCTR